MRRWIAKYRTAESLHGNGYVGLLAKASEQGNRTSRLSEESRNLLVQFVENDYEDLRQKTKLASWAALKRRCDELGELNIRALAENKRPDASTKLAVAPFWNLSDDGRVCTGTMRRPDSASVASIPAWEGGFYESAFTHANVGRLTRHEGGFDARRKEITSAGSSRRELASGWAGLRPHPSIR